MKPIGGLPGLCADRLVHVVGGTDQDRGHWRQRSVMNRWPAFSLPSVSAIFLPNAAQAVAISVGFQHDLGHQVEIVAALQRIDHDHAALPFRLGQVPEVLDRRTLDRASLYIRNLADRRWARSGVLKASA